jgi:hypothetical protein
MEHIHWLLVGIKIPVVYVFLLRFPILCMLLLVGFRWIALRLKPDLLANLYDVDGPGTFLVTLTAILCSWSIFLTGWTIYSHGPERFWIGRWSSLGPPPAWAFAAVAILGLICVSGIFSYSPKQNPSRKATALWIGALGGILVCAAFLFVTRPVAERLGQWRLLSDGMAWFSQTLGRRGYVDAQGHIYPEHLTALAFFLVSLLVYGILGLFKRSRRGEPTGIPALVYVLLLLMLATWTLPALSFALDPFHVPVLLLLVAWLIVISRSPKSDHYFDTVSIPYVPGAPGAASNCAPNPAEVLAFPADGKVVLVAASGGGIQAAAWTARVLTGLEQQNAGKFARAVRLISSVSGGSVGSLYFSSRYQADGGVVELPDVVSDAKTSSLEDVSWGLAYPDLLRVLFPAIFWKFGGRGRALERAWMHTPKLQKLLAAKLSDWFAGVRAGMRPANIFNATLVETGDGLLFSTTYLPVGQPPTPPARWDFHEFHLNDAKTITCFFSALSFASVAMHAYVLAPLPRAFPRDFSGDPLRCP